VFPISVPPLRQRTEDIPELARHFLARISAEEGKRVCAIDAEALALLGAHHWPGNVRQLENAIFRAVVLTDGEQIGVREFPQVSAHVGPDALATQPMIDPSPAIAAAWPDVRDAAHSAAPLSMNMLALTDAQGEVRPLEEIERETIRFAIAHYREQMSEVARRLKIGRSTLYRKLEGLGLEQAPQEVTEKENVTA
jgi:DNA-binding NtrC family response regulator